MKEESAKNRVKEYESKKTRFEEFAKQVLSILQTIISEELPNVKVASYSARAKTPESLLKKLQKDKYDEQSEITDLAGVRIILYSQKDIPAVEQIVKDNFLIDEVNSIDKTLNLGNDKVGYRGHHYVVSFDEIRMNMPENKRFHGFKCEIQITSLIAHTWSEITHEKGYKFDGVLPENLERRKNLLAGMLELADLEMDAYVEAYDAYVAEISKAVEDGGLDLPINTKSIEKYMAWKFPMIEPQIFRDVDEIIQELNSFGLQRIRDLDLLVTKEFEQHAQKMTWRSCDGIIRNILILSDAEKYFTEAWNPMMNRMNKKNYELYKRCGINIDKYIADYAIRLV